MPLYHCDATQKNTKSQLVNRGTLDENSNHNNALPYEITRYLSVFSDASNVSSLYDR